MKDHMYSGFIDKICGVAQEIVISQLISHFANICEIESTVENITDRDR